MKLVKFLCIFILALISKFALSQPINLETVTFNFVPKENGVVLLNYNQPTTMRVNVTVSRPITGTWATLPIKGEVKLWYYNYSNNTEVVLGVINVSNSDWYGPEYTISKVITKDLVIPADAVSLSKPYMDVSVYWRYYKDGYPSPYNTNGWIDWMDKGYQPMKLNLNTIPTTSFVGPSQVCSESIYTITNPYTISLENASGIATLTVLGNNQWKVSRIGGANGKVILRSTYNGKTFDKEIAIGIPNPSIVGPSEITAPPNGSIQDYSFSVNPTPGATYQWSFEGSNNVSFQSSTTGYSTTILVKSHTGTAPYYCKIRLKVTTECGTSDFIDYNVKITPAQGGVRPPDL